MSAVPNSTPPSVATPPQPSANQPTTQANNFTFMDLSQNPKLYQATKTCYSNIDMINNNIILLQQNIKNFGITNNPNKIKDYLPFILNNNNYTLIDKLVSDLVQVKYTDIRCIQNNVSPTTNICSSIQSTQPNSDVLLGGVSLDDINNVLDKYGNTLSKIIGWQLGVLKDHMTDCNMGPNFDKINNIYGKLLNVLSNCNQILINPDMFKKAFASASNMDQLQIVNNCNSVVYTIPTLSSAFQALSDGSKAGIYIVLIFCILLFIGFIILLKFYFDHKNDGDNDNTN